MWGDLCSSAPFTSAPSPGRNAGAVTVLCRFLERMGVGGGVGGWAPTSRPVTERQWEPRCWSWGANGLELFSLQLGKEAFSVSDSSGFWPGCFLRTFFFFFNNMQSDSTCATTITPLAQTSVSTMDRKQTSDYSPGLSEIFSFWRKWKRTSRYYHIFL